VSWPFLDRSSGTVLEMSDAHISQPFEDNTDPADLISASG
jgi:hypothetical protein